MERGSRLELLNQMYPFIELRIDILFREHCINNHNNITEPATIVMPLARATSRHTSHHYNQRVNSWTSLPRIRTDIQIYFENIVENSRYIMRSKLNTILEILKMETLSEFTNPHVFSSKPNTYLDWAWFITAYRFCYVKSVK